MKTAFVLSGGGAKGSFQVGVMRGLADKGVYPDRIYGTSVGAINSAGYKFIGPHGLERLWLEEIKGFFSVFKFNWLSLLFRAPGLFNAAPLRNLLLTHCKLPALYPKMMSIVTKVHSASGKLVHVQSEEDNFLESVEASAAIPGLAEPVNGYVDGGVRNQIPLQIVFDTMPDVERIVVILCNPYYITQTSEKTSRSWLKNALRALEILQHSVFIKDIEACMIKNSDPKYRPVNIEVYAPYSFSGSSLDFSPNSIRRGIDHGRQVADQGPIKSAQAGR